MKRPLSWNHSTLNMAQRQAGEMRKHATEASQFIHSDEHTPIPSVDEFALAEMQVIAKLEGRGGNLYRQDPMPQLTGLTYLSS